MISIDSIYQVKRSKTYRRLRIRVNGQALTVGTTLKNTDWTLICIDRTLGLVTFEDSKNVLYQFENIYVRG